MPYIAPPPPPGLLGWDGQQKLPVTASGLSIVTGLGMTPSVQGGKLRLDSQRLDPPEAFSHFVPGLLTAKQLATWHNDRVNGVALLTILEANLGTAPGLGVDANNFLAVVVSGAAGGSTSLPLNAQGTTHYLIDKSSDSPMIYNQYNTGSAHVAGSDTGFAAAFSPSAAATATGLQLAWDAGSAISGHPINAAIFTDNALTNQIASGQATAGSTGVTVPFTVQVALNQGQTYWMAWWQADGGAAYGYNSIGFLNPSSTSFYGISQAPTGLPNGGTAYGQRMTGAGGGAFISSAMVGGYEPPQMALLGPAGAVKLTGDISVSLAATGAPTAANVGNDLNIRAMIVGS